MTQFLIRRFIHHYQDVQNAAVRTAYGKLASVVGIVCNLLLFAGKGAAGALFGSIAIMADAVNNLSDASSNIVSLVGFKLAARPADEKHPYGHARYEYLAGLAVCAMILGIGISLLRESFVKLLRPERTAFSWLSVGVLAASILVKLWLSRFNRTLGEAIHSDTLLATAADSRNDVVSTGAVLLATFLYKATGYPWLDGAMGLAVAAFILWSSWELIVQTLSPLLGESPSPELVTAIERRVLAAPGVLGVHDLMVHDYGPGHQFASLHIEFPVEIDPMDAHDIIDNIERAFLRDDNIQVTIHYDPIVTADERVGALREAISHKAAQMDPAFSIHDLRIVPGPTHTNVLFDLVLPAGWQGDRRAMLAELRGFVHSQDDHYIAVIKVEQSYAAHEQSKQ